MTEKIVQHRIPYNDTTSIDKFCYGTKLYELLGKSSPGQQTSKANVRSEPLHQTDHQILLFITCLFKQVLSPFKT